MTTTNNTPTVEESVWNKETYTFSKAEFTKFIEWCRVNGESHRGNLQKNGVELYRQYLIEEERKKNYRQ